VFRLALDVKGAARLSECFVMRRAIDTAQGIAGTVAVVCMLAMLVLAVLGAALGFAWGALMLLLGVMP
jgi:hypothetical protein